NADHTNRLLTGLSGQGQSPGSGAVYNFSGGESDLSRDCGRPAVHRPLLRGVAMIPGENAVLVRDLVVQSGGRIIVARFNFEIKCGEVLVLLGESGSGKSTLLRHLIGLERPLSGSIVVKGIDLVRCSEEDLNRVRGSIGVSFQHAALFASMTVSENVAFPLL